MPRRRMPRVKRECQQCGKHFTAQHCEVARGYGKFCSMTCSAKYRNSRQAGAANPNWKGGRSKRHYFYKKRQVARHPQRIRARDAVYKAVRSGKLEKGPCEVCGTTEKVQAHHDDYYRPLDVRWLCRTHHRELHEQEAATSAASAD